MNGVVGQVAVWVAFAAALLGGVLLAVQLLRSGKGWAPSPVAVVVVVVVSGLVAFAAMEHAFVTHDYSLQYVADNNARTTPFLYDLTGMWSDLEGSILLWAVLLSLVMGTVVAVYRRRLSDAVVRWATTVLLLVTAFFFGLMVGPANPFTKTAGPIPTSGAGPNALLQDNPLVAAHPPLLYLGFVGTTVPFAFAIAMLITGRVGESWLVATRRWMLLSWTALSVGIVLGAWWSYQVLGWGGFWAWDPVENAALMPWLVGTAYLHSVLVEERRGLFRVWNLSLAIGAFALTVLGTFLTRSGVVQSVHAFSNSTLGPLLIGAFAVVVVVGFGLIALRGDRLRSPVTIDTPFGREGAFVANNLAFVGFALVVLLGTTFPLLFQAWTNQQVTVGSPYFNAAALPVGFFLLFMMAVAPLMSWRASSVTVLWRRAQLPAWIAAAIMAISVLAGLRGVLTVAGLGLGAFAAASAVRSATQAVATARRQGSSWPASLSGPSVGGMVVHIGVVLLAVGVICSVSFERRSELAAPQHAVVHFDGHRFEFLGLEKVTSAQKSATVALVRIDGGGIFKPAVSTFAGRPDQAVGTPAIDSGIGGDLYLTFDAVGGNGNQSGGQVIQNLPSGAIALGVVVEPMIPWIWIGGLVVGLGGLLAVGARRRAPRRERVAATSATVAP